MVIHPGDHIRAYAGRSAHIADSKSEWLPRVSTLCGQWHPRSGKFAPTAAPDLPVCRACQREQNFRRALDAP